MIYNIYLTKRLYCDFVPYHPCSYFRKRGEMCERPKWKPRSSEMHRNSRPNVPTIYYRFFQGTGNNNFRYLQCNNIVINSGNKTRTHFKL